jgi:glycerophosphoryl diester phosphodiesterase
MAFNKAYELPIDGIECDLGITKDLEPVIFHDSFLKRLCGVSGRLEDTSWKELRSLRVFGKEPICHLDDLLATHQKGILNIEIKLTARGPELLSQLARRLESIHYREKILISSFSPALLQQAHRNLSKGLKYALIFDRFEERKVKAMESCPWITQWNVRASSVLNAHPLDTTPSHRSRDLWLWTVNDEGSWRRAQQHPAKICGIFTDFPDLLAKFLSA